MKYVVEIVSGGMIYIPSFIKMDSGVQKLLRGIHMEMHTHRQGDIVSLHLKLKLRGLSP
jgi:hypothetical protein